jgi:hypothetical protein
MDDEQYHAVELSRGTRGFGFSIRGGREFQNMPLFVLQIAEGGPAAVDGRLNVSYTACTGSANAGVHEAWIVLPVRLNVLWWSLIFLYSFAAALFHAFGANTFEVALIFAGSGFGGLVVSMLTSGTQDHWFEPGQSRLIFRAKKSIACLPSEGK